MRPRKLSLLDAIHDSPKTHAVLSVFEEDARMLKKFATEFLAFCEKIHAAQQAMASATKGLAELIKNYGGMKFPMEKKSSCLMTTFPMLAEYMDEIGAMHLKLAGQISSSMISPLSRFIKADLEELMQLQNLYWLISDEHELSVQRYSKLTTGCSLQSECDAADEVYHMRKKLHRTALHYFSSMNLVQQRRQMALLEPLAGHLQAHLGLFKMEQEFADRRDLDTLSGNSRGLLLCLQREFDIERAAAVTAVAQLESAYPDSAFFPDVAEQQQQQQQQQQFQQQSSSSKRRPLCGYLMQRCRLSAGGQSRWERLHFSLRRGGRLEIAARGRLSRAGSPAKSVISMRPPAEGGCGASATAAEMDDRRNVFIVTVPGACPLILQAESARERDNWISAIAETAAAGPSTSPSGANDSAEEDSDDNDFEDNVEPSESSDEASDSRDDPLWLDGSKRSSMSMALSSDFDKGAGVSVAGAAFCRSFPVRLISRCLAKPDAVADAVLEASVVTASTSEDSGQLLTLTVSELGVWLVEPDSRLIRCRLPLGRARICQAGRRLLGLTAVPASKKPPRRVECLALRLTSLSDADSASTTESVLAAVSAAAWSADVAHEKETALLLSNISRLPNASPPKPPPRQQSGTSSIGGSGSGIGGLNHPENADDEHHQPEDLDGSENDDEKLESLA